MAARRMGWSPAESGALVRRQELTAQVNRLYREKHKERWPMLDESQQDRLATHLAGVLGAKSVRITNVKRFHGGASRETFGIDTEVDGVPNGFHHAARPGGQFDRYRPQRRI
jgi:hypothetical protein